MAARVRERGNRDLVFNGDRVSVGVGEKDLEKDGCDGSTTMRMYLMSLNCIL